MPTTEKRLISSSNIYTFATCLDSICNTLNTIYDINNGGCCYIAYVIAEILEKENIQFLVMVDADDCLENFKDYNDVHHIWIQTEDSGYKIDINKGGWESGYDYCYVTSKDILDMYNKGEWNDMYNASKNRFIKHIINELYVNFSGALRE